MEEKANHEPTEQERLAMEREAALWSAGGGAGKAGTPDAGAGNAGPAEPAAGTDGLPEFRG